MTTVVLLETASYLTFKTQQRFLVLGSCFDISYIIISHFECVIKIFKMVGVYNYSSYLQPNIFTRVQVNGVALCSLLASVLANLFMGHYEKLC